MRYSFKDIVIDSRTGLNPRRNFVLGNGTNNYITIKDIYNGQINITDKTDKVDDAAIQIIKRRSRIKVGDILFVSIGRIGETAIVTSKDDSWDVNESVFVFTVNTGIITPEYFCLMFQSEDVRKHLTTNSSGSTFKSIKMNQLERMTFDLPSLSVQKSISSQLAKVKAVCLLRERELERLDDLIKARFVEMFGDPIDTSLNRIPLSEYVDSIRYGTSQPPEFDHKGSYKFIRATNIKYGRIVEKDMLRISEKEAKRINKCRLHTGELIIVRSGANTGDTCVITNDYDGQYAGYDIIVSLKTDMLNPVFLNEMINIPEYMRTIVKPLTARSAQPHLNAQQVQSLPVVVADKERQNEFETFCKQINKSKFVVQQALDKTQLLFDSLMQKYFGG